MRESGRNMAVYIGLTDTAAASPVPYMSEYSINAASDKIEVTAGGDANKVYVGGLPDFSGTISGFADKTATSVTDPLWRAAQDGKARRFYLYPDSTEPTRYFYGTALFDYTTGAGVASARSVSSSITAAGSVFRAP